MTVRTMPAPTALSPRIASARRKAVARKSLPSAVTDHVSGPAHSAEQGGVKIAIDLGPQPGYVNVDYIRLRIEVIVPHMLEKHRPRDDLASILHEIFEEAKLARLKDDLLPRAGHLVGKAVEHEIGDAEYSLLRSAFGPPPRQSLDPRQKLGKCV